jgi:hypothetical protein
VPKRKPNPEPEKEHDTTSAGEPRAASGATETGSSGRAAAQHPSARAGKGKTRGGARRGAPERPARQADGGEAPRVEPDAVRVREVAAVKYNTTPSRPGYPSGMADIRTHFHLEVWATYTAGVKEGWADVRVLDGDGQELAARRFPLAYARPAGDGGDVLELDEVVYEGPKATQGSVEPRPDARAVEFRVYFRTDGGVLTDGTLHRCELRSDIAST